MNTRRQIIVLQQVVCWTLVLMASSPLATPQSTETRIVVGIGVACRAKPHVDAGFVKRHHLGEQLNGVSRVTVDGDEWYGTSHPGCWTYGPLTIELDTMDHESGLLAVADHALAQADAADFEYLVAVDNLFNKPRGHSQNRDTEPPMLALRHLQVIERAASRVQFHLLDREPLKHAWVLGKSNVLEGPEVIGRFQVPARVYWELYERHEGTPEAETIAWVAVQAPTRFDECGATCFLRLVERNAMRYWVAFPDGTHIVEALNHGAESLVFASQFCVTFPSWTLPGTEESIARIRSSLDAVTVSGKGDLLAHLGDLDRCVSDMMEKDLKAVGKLIL